jgi:hypothetical protein
MKTAAAVIMAGALTTAKFSAAIVMDWIVVKRTLAIAGPLTRTTRATIDQETLHTATVSGEGTI